jgi:hypothetical protein
MEVKMHATHVVHDISDSGIKGNSVKVKIKCLKWKYMLQYTISSLTALITITAGS